MNNLTYNVGTKLVVISDRVMPLGDHLPDMVLLASADEETEYVHPDEKDVYLDLLSKSMNTTAFAVPKFMDSWEAPSDDEDDDTGGELVPL